MPLLDLRKEQDQFIEVLQNTEKFMGGETPMDIALSLIDKSIQVIFTP
jgi:hypothetical protein